MDNNIPRGVCQCGCGQATTTAKKSVAKTGVKAGEPNLYVVGHRSNMRGEKHPCWRGGRVLRFGYVLVHRPDHAGADGDGYVREHRLVVEEQIGRYLEPDEVVHHINGNRRDNRPENLTLLSSISAHRQHHVDLDRAGRWAAGYDACVDCGTTALRHAAKGRCTRCYARHHSRRWRQHGPTTWPEGTSCARCQRTDKPYYAAGLCGSCYTARRKGRADPPKAKRPTTTPQ